MLPKFGFGKHFIKWIKIFLINQESCRINGGKTTKYFKSKKTIGGLNTFEYEHLCTAYVDDTAFSKNLL